METIYAILILHETNKEINSPNIRTILDSVRIEVNENILEILMESLKGFNITEILKNTNLPLISQAVDEPTEVIPEIPGKQIEQNVKNALTKLFGD